MNGERYSIYIQTGQEWLRVPEFFANLERARTWLRKYRGTIRDGSKMRAEIRRERAVSWSGS